MNQIDVSRTQRIVALHNQIADHLKMSLEKAIEVGELLTEQKQSLNHGEFTPWIKKSLPFTDRTARNYMHLFRERDRLKTETISDLQTAYRLLTEPKPLEDKVGKFFPLDSQFTDWPLCKACGSNRVVEKLHWCGSGKQLEPEEHGLCNSCDDDQRPKCNSCGMTLHEQVFSHGLCRHCRKKELRVRAGEDAQTRLEEREKEFNQTPVDVKAEEFWTDIINKFNAVVEGANDGVPCAKVGDETLEKIHDFRNQLYNLIHCLNDVIEQSEVKVGVQ